MLEASRIRREPGTTRCSLVPPTPRRAGDRAAWNLPEMEWVPQVPVGGLATASSLGEEAGMRGAGFNWRRRRRKKGTPGVWEGNAWNQNYIVPVVHGYGI